MFGSFVKQQGICMPVIKQVMWQIRGICEAQIRIGFSGSLQFMCVKPQCSQARSLTLTTLAQAKQGNPKIEQYGIRLKKLIFIANVLYSKVHQILNKTVFCGLNYSYLMTNDMINCIHVSLLPFTRIWPWYTMSVQCTCTCRRHCF